MFINQINSFKALAIIIFAIIIINNLTSKTIVTVAAINTNFINSITIKNYLN